MIVLKPNYCRLDRALPKLCMRMSEQLCKNIETAIGVAYGKTSAYAKKRHEERYGRDEIR